MADNNGDNFNGNHLPIEDQLARLYASRDAQVIIIQHLEADVAESRQACVDWCAAYIELVQALGFKWIDIKAGKVKHDDIIKAVREEANERKQ